jgi:hypothetical protein
MPDHRNRTETTSSTPLHNRAMTTSFLTALDLNTEKIKFRFVNSRLEIDKTVVTTPEKIQPLIDKLNAPDYGCDVYIMTKRPRALFVITNDDAQAVHAWAIMEACGARPGMAVKNGSHLEFFYPCGNIPRDQFPALQKRLAARLGTDPIDPPWMRLPGTRCFDNPAKPRLVKLYPNGAAEGCKPPTI